MYAKYLIIDTETTGFYFGKNGLIQLACIGLDKELNEVFRYCKDICPPVGFEISPEAMEITGFSLERIESGISYKQFCGEFLDLLVGFFPSNKPIIIAQFYPFDYAFLYQVFMECGLHEQLSQKLGNDFIDTKSIVNMLNLQADMHDRDRPFPVTSLSKKAGLKDILGISQESFLAHDALGDCLATREVLIRLANKYSF
jgi:DNA polymerase III epsilon subunit-like protein